MLGTSCLKVEIVCNKYMPRVRFASGRVLRDTPDRPRDPRPVIGRGRHSEGTDSVDIDCFAWLHLAPNHVPVLRVDRHLGLGHVCCECKGPSASSGIFAETSSDRICVFFGSRKSRLCRRTRPGR